MSDYQRLFFRCVNEGIDLHVAVDKVEEGKWLKLKNVRISQEGHIASRQGLDDKFGAIVGAGPIYNIIRLDGSTLLIQSGDQWYHNTTAYATVNSSHSLSTAVPFKPKLGHQIWAYIGDRADSKMRKFKADGTDQKWGITKPSSACTAAAGAAGNLDSSVPGAVSYDWRQTFYSDTTGAESNPSPVMSSGLALTAQQGSVTTTTSADAQVTDIRLYRRGGTLPDDWRYVGDFPNTVGPHTDNVADSTLALNERLITTNDVPFTSVDTSGATSLEQGMPYIFGPFVGKYILACGDEVRPGYVYWTNPGQPDGADPANSLSVTPPTEELIGGFIYNGSPYVYSRDDIYELVFGGPSAIPTFISRKTPVGRGVANPWCVAVGDLVYFVGNDGIYRTDCSSPAESITDESIRALFRQPTGHSEGDLLLKYVDYTDTRMRLSWAGFEVYFTYKDITASPTRHCLVYNPQGNRWRELATAHGSSATFGLAADDSNSAEAKIYLATEQANPSVLTTPSDPFKTADATTAVSTDIQTGFLDLGAPTVLKQFGDIILDYMGPAGNVATMTVRVDGGTGLETASQTTTFTGTGARTLYPIKLAVSGEDIVARNISFQFTWTASTTASTVPPTLYGFTLLWRPDSEAIPHWEFPATTHGLSGWQFARDLYLTLRSNTTSTLKVIIDGVTYTYSVPSTGGAKKKLYVPLQPAKGKVFKYVLDSDTATTPFRLYGDECEVRVRQWNTSLDYRLISPFGAQIAPTE